MVAIKLQKEENRKAFLEVFPTLRKEVLAELEKYNMPKDAYEWTEKVKCHHVIINMQLMRLCFMCDDHISNIILFCFFISDVRLQCSRWYVQTTDNKQIKLNLGVYR